MLGEDNLVLENLVAEVTLHLLVAHVGCRVVTSRATSDFVNRDWGMILDGIHSMQIMIRRKGFRQSYFL